MGSKPKSVSAPKADYSKDIGKFVSAYGGALPQVLGFEQQFRPEFQALNLQDISGFLGGVGGQEGLFGLSRMASQEAGQQLGAAREAELGQMAGQASLTRGIMEGLSPEQARAVSMAGDYATQAQGLESEFGGTAARTMNRYGSQVGQYGSTLGDISGYAGTTISDAQAQELAAGTLGGINPYVGETISGANADVSRATQMAEEAFQRRGTLSPEEQRMAQQQAREAGAASGRLGGNAAIAAEIQNREAAKAARRGEAAQLGQQAFGQQLGAAGQRLASEQALYGQRGANVERDVALQQARFGQGLGGLQQRLATQQARYGQLGSEQERELARRQNLFSQDVAGGAQRAQERQLGFGQLMDIEQRRAALRGEAAGAGQNLYGMAQGFYTQPGLALLSQQPLSYQTGQGMLGLGMGGMKQGTPGLINPDMGLNLGAAERQNALNASAATQQARASYSSGLFGGLGSMVGGAAAGLGTMASTTAGAALI